MTHYYGFTIKNIRQGIFAEEHEILLKMGEMIKYHKAILVEYYFEKDSIGRNHVHGTMMARKGLFLSKFKVPYWTIHIDKLETDEDRIIWGNYIRKDQVTAEQYKLRQEMLDDGYNFIDPPSKST